LPFSVDKVKF